MRTTFINGDQKLVETGRKHLNSRAENFEFFARFNGCETVDDLRERLRDGDFSFCEMRNAIRTFNDSGANFCEYGLSFDFMEADKNNHNGYYCYQISWGGPSEEIRFYKDGLIEFVYLDWFVGVGFNITEANWAIWLRNFLIETGTIDWDSLEPERIEYHGDEYGDQEA